MPERKNIRRYESPEVQGKDSWVEVSRLTVNEARKADRRKGDESEEAFTVVADFYVKHIHAWNWVDDDGQPMPLPKDDADVIGRLTDREFAFLGDCLAGSEAEEKNAPSASS